MSSQTAEARAWIDALPLGAFFFASEVPGRPSVVHPLLSRLAATADYPVQRQMQGFYVKAWRPGDPDFRCPNRAQGALKLAGPGGGGTRCFALHRAGWTDQIPCRYDFVTVGQVPTSPWPQIRFRRRSNEERTSLTSAEVTLLEAVRSFHFVECRPWAEALASLANGRCEQRMRLGGPIRAEELLRVSETEQCRPAEFHRRMADVAEALTQRPASALA